MGSVSIQVSQWQVYKVDLFGNLKLANWNSPLSSVGRNLDAAREKLCVGFCIHNE